MLFFDLTKTGVNRKGVDSWLLCWFVFIFIILKDPSFLLYAVRLCYIKTRSIVQSKGDKAVLTPRTAAAAAPTFLRHNHSFLASWPIFPNRVCVAESIRNSREEQNGMKQWRLTRESKRTFAGVARRRQQPTRGDARCSVGAAVWLDQAGVAHILAELTGPPRRANTLGEKQESDMSACFQIFRLFLTPITEASSLWNEASLIIIYNWLTLINPKRTQTWNDSTASKMKLI